MSVVTVINRDRLAALVKREQERYAAEFPRSRAAFGSAGEHLLGARAEYRFTPSPPVNGGESAAAADTELDEYMHLYTLNRGILMTPFHNMALMSPVTTKADVDAHTAVFGQAVSELLG
jgi:glutamate-1-semialdehyde aminotransferase